MVNDITVDTETLTRWEKRKRRTRNLLKQCTLDLLLEKGYVDLTVQHITDRADLARGTFYVHFTDKDEIIWTILQESMGDIVQQVLHGFVDRSYMERKYLTWKAVFAYAAEHKELLQVMFGEKGHPGFTQQIQDYFCQIIEQGIRDGVFNSHRGLDLPTEFMAQFMTGALVRLMVWSLDQTYTSAELAQMFYEMVYRETIPDEFIALE